MSDEKQETVRIAVLDGEGRYFGMKEVAAADVPAGAVVLPGCDLPCDGSYRYDRAAKAFVKPPPGKDESTNLQAETVAALAGIGFAMRAADLPMPPLTQLWLRWFEGTIDYTGLLSRATDGTVMRDAAGKTVMQLVKPSEFKG